MEMPLNIAKDQPTWQTSTLHGGDASRAVDGGLSTKYTDGSCTHTDYGPVVWAVDLGRIADIYYVEVLNRAEGGGKRLYSLLELCYVLYIVMRRKMINNKMS